MNDTTFIVIPAFNEESVIGAIVTELRAAWTHVVVIDDGSTDRTGEAARAGGATVLTHLINRGQGAALQTGISYALEQGAEYVVTFDSDGQHRGEDIPALLAPLQTGAADVALGSRFLGATEQMPLRRRILLQAAILFTRFASGVHFTDTHNGLRAFTRSAASRIELQMDRMAHASELLDQIVAARLRHVEVPVVVRYSDYSMGKGQRSSGAIRVLLDYVQGRWLR
ncbi:MAG TPA: glycosyltransferase family 2 protein [Thermoanaerobaculia bacterium]